MPLACGGLLFVFDLFWMRILYRRTRKIIEAVARENERCNSMIEWIVWNVVCVELGYI